MTLSPGPHVAYSPTHTPVYEDIWLGWGSIGTDCISGPKFAVKPLSHSVTFHSVHRYDTKDPQGHCVLTTPRQTCHRHSHGVQIMKPTVL